MLFSCENKKQLKIDSPLVIIRSSIQANGFASPWAKNSVQKKRYFGVFVTNDTILTTSKAVGNWVHLSMSRFLSEEKYELKLVHVDYESNLALLRVKNIKSFPKITPIKFLDSLSIGDDVNIKTLNENLQIVEESSAVESFESIKSMTSNFKIFSYKFNFSKKINNVSEIVLKDGKLAGIVSNKDSDFHYVTPSFVVKRYVEEVLGNNNFKGFSSLGFETESLFSRLYREYLKADFNGIRITNVNPEGAFFGKVKVNDLLLELAGKKIDEYGYVDSTKWGRVFYLSFLMNFKVGDFIEIKVNRKGEQITFKQKLKSFNSNEKMILSYRYNEKEPHIIFGGVVFQELSLNYLASWGSKWWKKAPAEMVQLWVMNPYIRKREKKRYIVVNRVLADTFNRGYRKISDRVVLKVNQKPVSSIKDVINALKKPIIQKANKFMKVTFTDGNGLIVLGYKGLKKSHRRIAKSFDVNSYESFFNPEL
jgi:hypothetical protein